MTISLDQKPSEYEIIRREVLYQGIFQLVKLHLRHRLYNGEWSEVFTREILERLSAVAVLPYDPVRDRVILIEQFRPGALQDASSPWTLEIPAGILDHEESLEEVAIREAEEEAGCKILQLELIHQYHVSPGGSNEYITIYVGLTDSTQVNGVHGLKEEHEDIRALNITAEEAFEKLRKGEIRTSPAIIALQWLELNRNTYNP